MATYSDSDGMLILTSIHGYTAKVPAGESYTPGRKDRLIRVDNSTTGGTIVMSAPIYYDGQEITILCAVGGGPGYTTAGPPQPITVQNAGHECTYIYDGDTATWLLKSTNTI